MTKKTLYIHIGTHKTGTTAIQSVFEQDSAKIAQQTGVQYIPFPNKAKGVQGDRIKAISALADDIAEIDSASKLFVSFEGFCGHYFYVGERAVFEKQFYQASGLIAQELAERLAPLSINIKIILCIRRQDEFLESAYKQTIHSGGYSSIEEYLATMNLGEDFRWDHLAESYASVFGQNNVSIINYDVESKSLGLLNSLGKILGAEIMASAAPRKNVSYSARIVEFAKEVNPYLTELQKRKLRLFLQRDVFGETAKPLIIGPAKRAEIYEMYKASNRKLAERFNIVQDTPDGLFQPFSGSQTAIEGSSNILLAKSMVINREALEAHSRLKKVVDEQALEIMDLRAQIKAITRQLNNP